MKYAFLKELIDLAEQYESSDGGGAPTSEGFARWVLGSKGKEEFVDERVGDAHKQYPAVTEQIETTIARMVIYLYRYAKLYSKKALEGSIIQSPDEFGYLATLLSFDKLSKSELIAKNIQEKPTGMEIIKRLLAQGLVAQEDDPNDRRSKLLHITDRGKGVLFQAFGKMSKVSDLIGGNLSLQEKEHLVYLLRKLDHFHYDLYKNDKEKTLNSLV
jgi:DNA-binding MarR family transcriptional regulator